MSRVSSIEQLLVKSIQSSLEVKSALLEDKDFHSLVMTVGQRMADALRKGNKIIYFGNGGSAADAQHLAAELTGRYLRDRQGLPGLALTANASSITAIANDYSFEMVFARQLESLASPGDVAVGISTSGNSANVLKAVKVGRERGLLTVGMTGGSGGKLKAEVDYCICIPSEDTPRIQESHILIGHILCQIIEEVLCSCSEGNLSQPQQGRQQNRKP
jgi:D-sedoheptulose 7-phosphate isomerase